MDLVQHMMERLRPIVGTESWDYCVLWKLSKDQRLIEWVDCCCAGTHHQNILNAGDQELVFPVSFVLQCRDAIFQHPRTKSCDLLAQLPSSMPLNSGFHAQTMMSNQPTWLNFSNSFHSDISEGSVGTRALIPVPIGLIELFVSKQVSEDQSTIDFVATQVNISLEQQSTINTSSNVDSSFSVNINELKERQSKHSIVQVSDQKDLSDHFQPPVSPATMLENLNLSSDISDNQMHLCTSSPMNFLQQFNYTVNGNNKNIFMEGTSDAYAMDKPLMNPFKPSEENGFDQEMDTLQRQMMSENMNMHLVEPLENTKRQFGNDKDSVNRSDSVSDCSDPNDEEDDPKSRKRNGKGQSKNLVAERKRRKKLNDRLYTLRSLVPKITKLDRASILKDAIEYVMELQREVRDLQNELEDHSEDDGGTNNHSTVVEQEDLHGNGINLGRRCGHLMISNGSHVEASGNGGIEISKQNQGQQMEPQVEVVQLEENEFFVKVFCEHKPGGFVKLMEAFSSLGLEVTNVNVTSFRKLVMNVFKVERRDSEMVQADHVRESLLELTRNPSRGWPEITTKAPENGNGMDNNHHHHHSHLHNHQLKSQLHHHLHHLHN